MRAAAASSTLAPEAPAPAQQPRSPAAHLDLRDVRQQPPHGGAGCSAALRPASQLPLRLLAAAVQQLAAARGRGAADADVRQQRLLQGGHHLRQQAAQARRPAAAASRPSAAVRGGVRGAVRGGKLAGSQRCLQAWRRVD